MSLEHAPSSISNALEGLDIVVELCSQANPSGAVRCAKPKVRDLLKIANVHGSRLKNNHDNTKLDYSSLHEETLELMGIWCLALTIPDYEDGREYESITSKTSIDYSSEWCGLLLVEADKSSYTSSAAPERVYRRIGTYKNNI